MIYLDNAATTAMSEAALDNYQKVARNSFGNASSIHSAGREGNRILRQSRETIARLLAVQPDQVYFTSGASEANNIAIKGYALAHQHLGKHIISTTLEHHSVLHTLSYLESRFGFQVTLLEPIEGQIHADQVRDAIRPDTILVSTMFANNETGLLLPIQEIGQLLQNHQAVFHVDAVQAIGKIDLTPEKYHIDFLSASAHKFHGPKGTGFLYAKQLQFDPLIHGGKQERGHRAGTEDLPSISAMATALQESLDHQVENFETVQRLKQFVLESLPQHRFYLNETGEHLPYVLNIGFPGKSNDQLLVQLDLAGIAVSSGSACTAGVVQESHVLTSLYGKQSPRLKESIRISFSAHNTLNEVQQLIDTLHQILGEN
ncbi:cysteine desulfurase family protein [Streptococcus sp. DD13]|uniref:cysteine desulfurase family protein n=1 Tax=Streptococcus sp. DD13 TaxID=1777881 RepID=UPI0007955EA4|nr:cysteine desulfurase family protein [Streptococcus sp. DD13]KXT78680.1 Cysteine desulfurase [Streptococcus sp. DD13]